MLLNLYECIIGTQEATIDPTTVAGRRAAEEEAIEEEVVVVVDIVEAPRLPTGKGTGTPTRRGTTCPRPPTMAAPTVDMWVDQLQS